MSKMREALRDFIQEWERRSGHPDPWVLIDEIAQRYGPLEFTREEVRELLVEAYRTQPSSRRWGPAYEYADDTILRFTEAWPNQHQSTDACLGESESGEEKPSENPPPDITEGLERAFQKGLEYVDDTPTIKASEIEAVMGEKVPGSAKYIVRHSDGTYSMFRDEPETTRCGDWVSLGGAIFTEEIKWVFAADGLVPGPWQDSLRRIVHDEPEVEPTNGDILNLYSVTRHMGKRLSELEASTLDREVGEIQGELITLTKRVAAIEKRVLADGHHKRCAWVEAVSWHESTDVDVECTCGHDKIRENAK